LLKEGHCLRDDVLLSCTRAKAQLRSSFATDQLASIFQFVRSALIDRGASHGGTPMRWAAS